MSWLAKVAQTSRLPASTPFPLSQPHLPKLNCLPFTSNKWVVGWVLKGVLVSTACRGGRACTSLCADASCTRGRARQQQQRQRRRRRRRRCSGDGGSSEGPAAGPDLLARCWRLMWRQASGRWAGEKGITGYNRPCRPATPDCSRAPRMCVAVCQAQQLQRWGWGRADEVAVPCRLPSARLAAQSSERSVDARLLPSQ